MQNIDSLTLQRNFGQVLQEATLEPIMIKKYKKDFVVIMSANHYKTLAKMEEDLLLKAALKQDKKGYIGVKKSKKLIDSLI